GTHVATAWQAAPAKKKVTLSQKERAKLTVKFAYAHIGDRYQWGGNGPHAWDCSGLAIGAWRHAGVKLSGRVTTTIYERVHKKVRFKDLQPGDLVFFSHL